MTSVFDYNAPISPGAYAANLITNTIRQDFLNLVSDYRSNFDRVWRPVSGAGYTTADVLASLGVYATSVFAVSAATTNFINTVQPGTLTDDYLSPLQPVTFHEDGTVTLTPQP